MNIDLNVELGRLLTYVANVTTAIRKNSAYNESYCQQNGGNLALDVMWLSDSLHCFDRLGQSIQAGNPKEIVAACDSLLEYYRLFIDGPGDFKCKGDPKASIERYRDLFDPQEAMAVFAGIRAKALDVAAPGVEQER